MHNKEKDAFDYFSIDEGITASQGYTTYLSDGERNYDVEKWGDFNFNGGTMNVTSTGIVDFVSGNMTLLASGGAIKGGALNIVDGTTSSFSAGNVYATNLEVTGSFSVDELYVGVTDTNFIDDDEKSGILITSGGALVVTDSTSFASDVADGALTINNGGKMTATTEGILELNVDNSGFIVDDYAKTGLDVIDGTLALKYNGIDKITLTKDEFEALKGELLSGENSSLHLYGVTIDGNQNIIVDPSGTISNDVDGLGGESVTLEASDINPGTTDITIGGELAAINVIVENNDDINQIIVDDDVFLAGSGANNPLISNSADSSSPLDLTAGNDVALGDAGQSNQGGTLGDVTLTGANAASGGVNFTVDDGNFTVGSIDVENGGTLSENVHVAVTGTTSNTVLTTDGIDLSDVGTTNTTTVSADNATINVAGGDITLNGGTDAKIETKAGTILAKNVDDVTSVDINGGSITVSETMTFSDSETASVKISDGTLSVGTLDLSDSNGGLITVGANDAQGVLKVDEVTGLNGATIFSDPAWSTSSYESVSNASKVIIGNIGVLDGAVIAGRNSYFLYGNTDAAWMENRVNEAGAWGQQGITAAMGLYKPLELDGTSGSVVINGQIVPVESGTDAGEPSSDGGGTAMTIPTNEAIFAENSLLVVNASNSAIAGGTAALTGDGVASKLTVDKNAMLYLYNAQAGKTYQITSDFNGDHSGTGAIGVDTWTGENGRTDSSMLSIDVWTNNGGVGSDVFARTNVHNAYDVYAGRISDGAAGMLNWVYGYPNGATAMNDVDSNSGGVRFLSRSTSSAFNSRGDASRDIEGAAQIAALGGAPLNAFNIMHMSQNAVSQRFSFSSGFVGAPEARYDQCGDSVFMGGGSGLSIWAGGEYQHGRVKGMEVGSFENGFKSNYGGANFGLDYTSGDNVRFGIMGSAGAGKNKTDDGDFAHTENKFDYYGVRAFAGWSMCNFSLLADGGFTYVKNKLDQSSFDGPLHSKANVHGWDVGLTAEYKIETSALDIIPHAGLRYEGINTRNHDVKYAAGPGVMEVGSSTQHLLTIPVGVNLSKNIYTGAGWKVTPFVDVGAVTTVGNRSYKSDTKLFGVAMPSYGFKTKMIDPVAFDGSAGLNVDNGRFFGGVNYNITHSKNQTTHGFLANVGVNF